MSAQRFLLVLFAPIAISLHSYSQLSKELSVSVESSVYKPKDYLGHLENSSFAERFGFTNDIGVGYLLSKNKSTLLFGINYQRALLNYTEGFITSSGYTTVEHEREESYDFVAFNLRYDYRIGQLDEINSFHLSFGLEVSYAFHYQKRKEAYRTITYDPSSAKPLFERPIIVESIDESNFEVNRYGLKQIFLRPRAGFLYSRQLDEQFSLAIGSSFILGSVINQEFETDFGTPHYDNGDFRDWWSFSLRVGLRYNL